MSSGGVIMCKQQNTAPKAAPAFSLLEQLKKQAQPMDVRQVFWRLRPAGKSQFPRVHFQGSGEALYSPNRHRCIFDPVGSWCSTRLGQDPRDGVHSWTMRSECVEEAGTRHVSQAPGGVVRELGRVLWQKRGERILRVLGTVPGGV